MIKKTTRGLILLLAILIFCTSCNLFSEAEETTQMKETTTTIQKTDEPVIDIDHILEYTPEDIRALETKSGKKAAVAIDIVCQLCTANFGLTDIRASVRNIRNLGIDRVYLIMCSPSYPVMSGGMITAIAEGYASTHVASALERLGGDPNKIYIDVCHEFGLEAIAVIKPYEGGGGCTIPEGTSLKPVSTGYSESFTPKTAGGQLAFVDSMVAQHPEMRVQRKANSGEKDVGPITKIELYYLLGSNNPDLAAMQANADNKPTLWVSRDNASYRICNNITYTYDRVNGYAVTDANGNLKYNRDCVRLTVKVTGLTAQDKYAAVTLSDLNFLMAGNYGSYPYSMTALYNGDTRLASTLGYYVRTPYDAAATSGTMVWGSYGSVASPTDLKGLRVDGNGNVTPVYKDNVTPNGAEKFTEFGFEYEFVYTSAVTNGFRSPVIALAVGKNEYVQGMLCEGYGEVRDYWMEQVNSALNYGADGIDIRWDSHSCMISDFYYYGYNEPIATEYKKQYGVELNDEPVNQTTATRVMTIRGEFFLQFLKTASKAAHDKGAIFLTELFATGYTSDIDKETYVPETGGNHVGQWKMPKIIVRDYKAVIDLCDEVVYKDYFTGTYASSDWTLGYVLTHYAHTQGKKIWIHCYVQQNGGMMTDAMLKNFLESPSADGMILYEITDSYPWDRTAVILKTYVQEAPAYSINLLDRIGKLEQGITARELIESVHFLGENVVVDGNGNSVPLDTVLTSEMKLCVNRTAFYTFNFKK